MTEPLRDQYGRFVLLMLPLELTPRDVAHWSPETRVLVDFHADRGEAEDVSHSVIDSSRVAPYRLQQEYGDRYWVWSSSDMFVECDNFNGLDTWHLKQEQVPVALYTQGGEIGRAFTTPIILRASTAG